MAVHKGEIVERAIRRSAINISDVAKELGKSRTTLYRWLEDPNLTFSAIKKIGEIIGHDFSSEIKDLPSAFSEDPSPYRKSNKNQICVTVTLDGTQETVDKWLKILPEVNKIVRLNFG